MRFAPSGYPKSSKSGIMKQEETRMKKFDFVIAEDLAVAVAVAANEAHMPEAWILWPEDVTADDVADYLNSAEAREA